MNYLPFSQSQTMPYLTANTIYINQLKLVDEHGKQIHLQALSNDKNYLLIPKSKYDANKNVIDASFQNFQNTERIYKG